MACCIQLLLHIAHEEGAVNLCHLEEEGEDVEKRGTREEMREVLDLFTGRVDTSLLFIEGGREGRGDGEEEGEGEESEREWEGERESERACTNV